jgi:hypothetical protein
MAWTLCTIFFLNLFIFSILQGSWTGYLSQEDLAEFGYRSERKVKLKNWIPSRYLATMGMLEAMV